MSTPDLFGLTDEDVFLVDRNTTINDIPSTPSILFGPLAWNVVSQLVQFGSNLAHIITLGTPDELPRAACSGQLSIAVSDRLKNTVVISQEITHASAYALVENSLTAVQTALAAEAWSLGLASRLDPIILYTAIAGAAGSSWSFKTLIPRLLYGTPTGSEQTLDQARQALIAAVDVAAEKSFYAPLMALAQQLYTFKLGNGSDSSIHLNSFYPQYAHVGAPKPVVEGTAMPKKVGFIGLGAMGYGMANVLRRANFAVTGYDSWAHSAERYVEAGGKCAASIEECAAGCDVLVLMVVNAIQAADVLFEKGGVKALPSQAVILLNSTVSPRQAEDLAARIRALRKDVYMVDCPVSGGTPRAASGDLTILAAGLEAAGPKKHEALAVLRAFSASEGRLDNLSLIPGGPGKGAAVKLVNQHLAGTHVSSVMEALTFAASLGLPLRRTRELLLQGPGWSWMMGHRGKNMLDGLLQPPTSVVNMFVKDTGIVLTEAAAIGAPVPLAAHTRQQMVYGKAAGWGLDDDSSLVRIWQPLGINVTCPP